MRKGGIVSVCGGKVNMVCMAIAIGINLHTKSFPTRLGISRIRHLSKRCNLVASICTWVYPTFFLFESKCL